MKVVRRQHQHQRLARRVRRAHDLPPDLGSVGRRHPIVGHNRVVGPSGRARARELG